jgi:coenzyme F420-0:L-glutamate ligase/coenzyme F420-1:gamma-L-glutamate ligase
MVNGGVMNSFTTIGLPTPLIHEGDDMAGILIASALESEAGGFRAGDVVVIAESALATAEERVTCLECVEPDEESVELAERYDMDPRLVQVVREESDEIVGGIPGFLLSMTNGTLLPNAGVDGSNAPPGCVVPLPRDPDASAKRIRKEILRLCGVKVGVIVADSRTHAMRSGCSGVAIGCSGILAVIDARGRKDLFGRELEVTKLALADNLASAAEIVMGEANESTPAAIIRGTGFPIGDYEGIESIAANECLFMGIIARRRDEGENY